MYADATVEVLRQCSPIRRGWRQKRPYLAATKGEDRAGTHSQVSHAGLITNAAVILFLVLIVAAMLFETDSRLAFWAAAVWFAGLAIGFHY